MSYKTFCTVVEPDYLYYALALNDSLVRFDPTISLNIFITGKKRTTNVKEEQFPNVSFLYEEDLCKDGIGKALYDKYITKDISAFRWSMKSVLMSYLLKSNGYKKVIFVDADIYFFNNYDFLWEELEENRLLLTPHWRAAIRFKQDKGGFDSLLTDGLFNAGFVAANQEAIPILNKWSEWCLYKCEKDASKSLYCDQGYLNLIPIYYEGVKIIRHKGCNVAGWNLTECTRKKVGEKVLIEGAYEIIFIHFVRYGVWFILNGVDGLLKPHFSMYVASMKKYKPSFDPYEYYGIAELEKKYNSEISVQEKYYQKTKIWLRVKSGKILLLIENKMGLTLFPKLKTFVKQKILNGHNE